MSTTLNARPTVEAVTTTTAQSTSKAQVWAGRVLSGLAVLFLIMDGAIKVVNIQPVVDASVLLGLPIDLAPRIGALLLACIIVYLIPRTAVVGAVLLTGFLGGAIAIQARVDAPLFSLIFPIILGALLWGGLYLRDRRVRALI
jgi:hypothetical protein